MRGSSPTESKQAHAAISDVRLRPQVLRMFCAADISLQKIPGNVSDGLHQTVMGTSYWIKHDANFPFGESGCIRKQAPGFPQCFCGFPGLAGPVVPTVEHMEPGEITSHLPAGFLHTQAEKC